MRGLRLPQVRRARLASTLGVLAGAITGMAAVAVAGSALTGGAIAQRPPTVAQAVFEAAHLPPLLSLPGEQIHLVYDVHCAPAGVDDPEQRCAVAGTVFLRAGGRGTFGTIALTPRVADGVRQLWARVPDTLASARGGFEYYAVLGSSGGGTLTVPSGGAEAPHRVLPLTAAMEVELGAHAFGVTRDRSARVASARWGNGPTDVGLEHGHDLARIGASSFDVDETGDVVVLDHANRRLLRWRRGASTPAAVPVSIDGRIADLSIARDGSLYVLESVPRAGRNPLVRRFDADGRELDVVETAERSPSQIRIGPAGPVVLQQPSSQWMPVAEGGSPVGPADQRRGARSGKPLRVGGEVVVLRRGSEIRVALLAGDAVRRSWLISSKTALAEVQLAEPHGQRLVLVVRVYTEERDEFAVLVLDSRGLVERFALPSADWAETAPLSRFRLVHGSLYRLGSSANGVFVDRFDLEVR